MDTFSFSRLSLYDDCPRRFYYKYVLGLAEKEGVPLWLGKAIHKAIECKIAGDSFDSALVQGMASINFNPAVPFNEMKFLLNNMPANVQGKTEHYFKLPLNEDGTLFIQGYIDLLQGNEITDWKSNRKMYGVNDTAQIGLYAWSLRQLYGYDEVIGKLYFLRFKRESAFVYDAHTMDLTRQWALQLANEIVAKLHEVEQGAVWKGIFPPVRSTKCSHCSFAIECYRSQSLNY